MSRLLAQIPGSQLSKTSLSASPKSKRAANTVLATALAAALSFSVLTPATAANAAPAFADSDSVRLPGTTIRLQANAWSPSFIPTTSFNFATSSKTRVGTSRYTVSTIRNTATIEARGVAPTISIPAGISASGDTNTKSLSWTNNRSWIADISGRASYGGLTTTIHVNSAAFAYHRGVKNYVDIWSW